MEIKGRAKKMTTELSCEKIYLFNGLSSDLLLSLLVGINVSVNHVPNQNFAFLKSIKFLDFLIITY